MCLFITNNLFNLFFLFSQGQETTFRCSTAAGLRKPCLNCSLTTSPALGFFQALPPVTYFSNRKLYPPQTEQLATFQNWDTSRLSLAGFLLSFILNFGIMQVS